MPSSCCCLRVFFSISLFVFLISSLCVQDVHCHVTFLAGRPWSKHGLIGRPKRSERFLVGVSEGEDGSSSKIPQRWFSQKLNHFDPTDGRTWKQVSLPFVFLHFVSFFTVSFRGSSWTGLFTRKEGLSLFNWEAKEKQILFGYKKVKWLQTTLETSTHYLFWLSIDSTEKVIQQSKSLNDVKFKSHETLLFRNQVSNPWLLFFIVSLFCTSFVSYHDFLNCYDRDLSVSSLKYLSSEQALADFANFISHFQSLHPHLASVPWVSFGGSYSGSLSAWMRLKYPHLIHSAVASSAPLLAVINFKEYLGVVRDSLGSECDALIDQATRSVNKLLKDSMTGWKTLTHLFNLCEPLDGNNQNDVANFMQALAGNFEGVVQYNKDNRDFEGSKATNITIDVVCSVMKNESFGEEIHRYAHVNKLLLHAYEQKCLDYTYSSMIETLSNTSWTSDAASGGRQWTYQTCTEFGFFQSSDLKEQPFGQEFPVRYGCVSL